jgi:PEGA domain
VWELSKSEKGPDMRPFIQAVTRKTILTAVFVFALAASTAAAAGRGGGGGHSGGGHMGGGGHFGGGHFGGGPHGHFDGGHGHFDGGHGHIFIGGGFFDPFWGYPYGWYGYPYGYGYGYGYGYPYGAYGYSTSSVKTEIRPKQAEVYVDGYYAGVADDFDGAFHRLHTSPGGHAVTLRLEGYRTVTQNVYVRPGSTFKLKETMERLAPGEVSQPVPLPRVRTGRSDSRTSAPDGGSAPQR